ncbi:hypothetical protein L596_015232 [Steinernema carpocapsae]|uniref:Uncharacterized protein n=1 Tax=Steinernema carpocapsae TaxID=34508 RepID=A0A4U5NED9_STECR|nr:hypothetical protein L596_015232 [Steinernema carpocapsae]
MLTRSGRSAIYSRVPLLAVFLVLACSVPFTSSKACIRRNAFAEANISTILIDAYFSGEFFVEGTFCQFQELSLSVILKNATPLYFALRHGPVFLNATSSEAWISHPSQDLQEIFQPQESQAKSTTFKGLLIKVKTTGLCTCVLKAHGDKAFEPLAPDPPTNTPAPLTILSTSTSRLKTTVAGATDLTEPELLHWESVPSTAYRFLDFTTTSPLTDDPRTNRQLRQPSEKATTGSSNRDAATIICVVLGTLSLFTSISAITLCCFYFRLRRTMYNTPTVEDNDGLNQPKSHGAAQKGKRGVNGKNGKNTAKKHESRDETNPWAAVLKKSTRAPKTRGSADSGSVKAITR